MEIYDALEYAGFSEYECDVLFDIINELGEGNVKIETRAMFIPVHGRGAPSELEKTTTDVYVIYTHGDGMGELTIKAELEMGFDSGLIHFKDENGTFKNGHEAAVKIVGYWHKKCIEALGGAA